MQQKPEGQEGGRAKCGIRSMSCMALIAGCRMYPPGVKRNPRERNLCRSACAQDFINVFRDGMLLRLLVLPRRPGVASTEWDTAALHAAVPWQWGHAVPLVVGPRQGLPPLQGYPLRAGNLNSASAGAVLSIHDASFCEVDLCMCICWNHIPVYGIYIYLAKTHRMQAERPCAGLCGEALQKTVGAHPRISATAADRSPGQV